MITNIEQRARELQMQTTPHKSWGDVHYGYIQGATEQRKIDIEKACEYLKKYNDKCELTEMVNISDFKQYMEK